MSQDEQGTRLAWLRVTGGELKVKAQLSGEADGEPWEEKANQLRLYSGVKYTLAEAIGPGQVCCRYFRDFLLISCIFYTIIELPDHKGVFLL